jgi:hypothetical protein
LRDLSPKISGSGSLKVQGDEAARLLIHAVNDNGRGACATVRGGSPVSSLAAANTGENRKMRKLAFNWKQFLFRATFFPESCDNPQPQNLPTARQ